MTATPPHPDSAATGLPSSQTEVATTPSAQYSLTLRVEIDHRPGMLGKVASAIGEAGGTIGAVDLVTVEGPHTIRDITVETGDAADWPRLTAAVNSVPGARVLDTTDRTFMLHMGGKIEVANKHPLKTRDDLSMAYTPGVARVCMAIHDDPDKAFQYTIKRNSVAVVSDGTAVLGLGDIGPRAAMPVMEGKAMLFKEFAGVDAFPVVLDTQDVDEIVAVVRAIAPGFGGINLEDISAPRCFEIEERLIEALDIPVFHDDQHGTAVVILAALINAARVVGKRLEDLQVVVSGSGAAGTATIKMLLGAGVRDVIPVDRGGALNRTDRYENPHWRWLAEHCNRETRRGSLRDVLEGVDVFIGVSAPGILKPEDIARMGRDPIVFAMANPNPEIMPDVAAPFAAVIATGRSDFPNQVNNLLAFPGIFRGALDVRASRITERMKLAAAFAIAGIVRENEVSAEYVIPSVLDTRVVDAVAKAVAAAAVEDGGARRAGAISEGEDLSASV